MNLHDVLLANGISVAYYDDDPVLDKYLIRLTTEDRLILRDDRVFVATYAELKDFLNATKSFLTDFRPNGPAVLIMRGKKTTDSDQGPTRDESDESDDTASTSVMDFGDRGAGAAKDVTAKDVTRDVSLILSFINDKRGPGGRPRVLIKNPPAQKSSSKAATPKKKGKAPATRSQRRRMPVEELSSEEEDDDVSEQSEEDDYSDEAPVAKLSQQAFDAANAAIQKSMNKKSSSKNKTPSKKSTK